MKTTQFICKRENESKHATLINYHVFGDIFGFCGVNNTKKFFFFSFLKNILIVIMVKLNHKRLKAIEKMSGIEIITNCNFIIILNQSSSMINIITCLGYV